MQQHRGEEGLGVEVHGHGSDDFEEEGCIRGGYSPVVVRMLLSLFLRSGEAVNIYVVAETALILEHGGSGPKDKSTI
jgi:hypothetical protein